MNTVLDLAWAVMDTRDALGRLAELADDLNRECEGKWSDVGVLSEKAQAIKREFDSMITPELQKALNDEMDEDGPERG